MSALLDNIRSQPAALLRLVKEWQSRSVPECRPPVVLTGMGSSLFAAYPAYLRMANAGLDVRLWETAELLHYGLEAIPREAAVVMVSQSGATAEILALRERLHPGQHVIAVTNEPSSPLAQQAGQVLLLGCPSQSLATTVTYTASLFVLEALAHTAARESLDAWLSEVAAVSEAMPDYLDRLQDSALPVPAEGGHLFLLARGPSLASAWQGALTFQEVAGVAGQPLSAAQFRHGPLEMAGPGLEAILFVPQGQTTDLLLRLARDIEDFGGRVFLIADERVAPSGCGHPAVSEAVAPFLNILPIQLAAVKLAQARGREPGVFRQATSVTSSE